MEVVEVEVVEVELQEVGRVSTEPRGPARGPSPSPSPQCSTAHAWI